MVRASRAVGLATETGDPLPEVPVLKPLHDQGVYFREGGLVLIAGPSGGGKSTLAQYIAAMMNVPTLAIIPDMDSNESIPRLIATLSGIPVADIEQDVESFKFFLDECEIDFCWDDSPSIEDVILELDRYVEMYDAWPKLIIIDNLLDIDGGEGELEAQRFVMNEMRTLAKRTNACVIVLTHTKEVAGSDYGKPQSRDQILYKINQKPTLILTLGREGDLFRIAVVKDRRSAATDPTAKRYITIMWQGETASFSPADADWARYAGVGL